MEENDKIVKQTYTDPVTGKFVKGNPGGGRPNGSLDFKTKFYKVIDKLAEQNNLTPEEVEEQILLVGYKKAKDGDYSFYRDLMDRIHGRPVQKQELTGANGKELPTPILNYVFSNNEPKQNSSDAKEDTSSTGGDISIEDNINPIVVD
mgnify:CR=1 FL=1